jgi:hypothetical protein
MAKPTRKSDRRHSEESVEDSTKQKRRGQAPGTSIESRENQIIRLAYDLVEKRIRNGTATSQEVTQFVKMGSSSAQLERTKLERENQLLEAKAEALRSQKKIEELYANAMKAFRTYSGQEEIEDEDD